jgi:hypothetical protein
MGRHLQIYLAANPYRDMAIDRVIVLSKSDGGETLLVLNVDALNNNPTELLKPFGSGYAGACHIWAWIALIVSVASIVLSFIWHWWSFIPGLLLGGILGKANQQSAADFAVEILARDKTALDFWNGKGLVWTMQAKNLVPA